MTKMTLEIALREYAALSRKKKLHPAELKRREQALDYLVKRTGQHRPRVAVAEGWKLLYRLGAPMMNGQVGGGRARRGRGESRLLRAAATQRNPYGGCRPAVRVSSVVSSAFEQGKHR